MSKSVKNCEDYSKISKYRSNIMQKMKKIIFFSTEEVILHLCLISPYSIKIIQCSYLVFKRLCCSFITVTILHQRL